MLKTALDSLIVFLKERSAQGRPNLEVQELVEKALTALMFGDVTVAENWLNLAADQLGLEEEEGAGSEESPSQADEIPPPEEIEALIAYFAERIEECVKKGINAEKTLGILLQAQEAYEKGDMQTAWRAARTGIKAFELEMECLEQDKKE